MSKRMFRVGRSRTGLGLFATEFIKKRTLIAEYKGRRITAAQSQVLEDRGAKYLYELNSKWTIDGSNRRNLARYGNHSCRPNAESDVIRGRKITIRAKRNIKPGEEITYHYGDDYLRNVIGLKNCKCDKCREKRAERARLYRAKKKQAEARAARAAERALAKNGPTAKAAPVKTKAKANGKAVLAVKSAGNGSVKSRVKASAGITAKVKTQARTKRATKSPVTKTVAKKTRATSTLTTKALAGALQVRKTRTKGASSRAQA